MSRTQQAIQEFENTEVEKMRREAEAHADEDQKRRAMIEARNTADNAVYTSEKTLKDLGDKVPADARSDIESKVQAVRDEMGLAGLAELLDVGEPTLVDILDALARPGRDPREDLPPPILRQDVLKMEDLREGMRLKGTVRNVVDFGAFVDIGVKQDGLVHVSKMADRYVRNPFEVVSVGDVVDVVVTSVDLERGRIGLSMRD